MYPQIGWKINGEVTYTCEGYLSGIGASVEWAKRIGNVHVISQCRAGVMLCYRWGVEFSVFKLVLQSMV